MLGLRKPETAAILILLVVVFSAAVALIVYGGSKSMPAGVTISGWSVSGMNIEWVEKKLDEHAEALRRQRVVLQMERADPNEAAWLMEQLGLTTGTDQVLSALRPLKEGSLWSRAKYRWQMQGRELIFAISIDESALKQTLLRVWAKVYDAKPANAQRIVEGDDTIRYVPEQNVERIDESKLAALLKDQLPPPGQAPPSASIAVKVPVIAVSPEVTLQKLKAEKIERKLAEFTTVYPLLNNSEGRIHNVRSTAASIHDVVLQPDEIFDYGKFIQLTEAKYGYKDAPVILNGKLVPGIGGGICQVSSTLYNAVLRSGLKIVERRNHSLPVSYVPLGQDATFASGYINFKFRNTTGAHLLIRTSTTDSQVTVKLFGSAPENITYDVESKTIETLEPPVKYVHNPQLPRGKTELLSKGKPGYKVETYRIKKVDGRIVGRELVSKDTYSAQPTLVAANRGGQPEDIRQGEETRPFVEDGVKGPIFR
ncbi:VanW family protein [Paenibacillus hamazuiensis]|uniref:VanW family protein n=1 Tax=Paenibacillus hamazuiensis TaxID=2936508 RepID=UPI00200D40BC|nr:VanW family protein [Paenibacillus hamazuiensis]